MQSASKYCMPVLQSSVGCGNFEPQYLKTTQMEEKVSWFQSPNHECKKNKQKKQGTLPA